MATGSPSNGLPVLYRALIAESSLRPANTAWRRRFAPVPFQVTSPRVVVSQDRGISGHDSETHSWLKESCR
jgi:hypothetical protein